MYKTLLLRPLEKDEIRILEHFLYEAIFLNEGAALIPRDIINKPELSVYIDDFGKDDDNCIVAECDGKIIGAVWTRILYGKIHGYGNIDEMTPEFAISLYKEYRNLGIGTKLMTKMLELLKSKGYKQASLAVQKDNYAYKMYSSLGFKTVWETEEEFIMVITLL